jgi:two-component system response regulator PilR (NtrC family)
MSHHHILVVDDEPDLRTLYELTLLRDGFRVTAAANLSSALHALDGQAFDLIITDMRLPDGLGIDLIRHVKTHHRGERSIVITAYGSAENAVESLKAGAFDYLTKPVELKQFRTVVASALQSPAAPTPAPSFADDIRRKASPLRGPTRLATAPVDAGQALRRLVGESSSMKMIRDRIGKVALSMAPILITGESGTGKELAAQAIHASSHRFEQAFVAVNCGAIPEGLLEAEFFGAKKGAYTGATQDRIGFFKAAHGGTLFLDEIGDLPLAMQSRLLRAIQERQVRPLGSTHEESVDVRIVSATHKNLAAEVQAGRFRQDLYYRLNVIDIHMPPLRERREDLPALCESLLQRITSESGIGALSLSPGMLATLCAEPLPGNVRELENLLHRGVALRDHRGEQLYLPGHDLLPVNRPVPAATPPISPVVYAGSALPPDLQGHLDRQERDILIQALSESGFNRTAAAARLGLSLRQIRYRIARLSIDVPANSDRSDDVD